MAIIFRKTAKGMAEIETRAHRLVPRMRSALILVDGKRSDAEIGGMILQQVTETLHALAGQGFIDVLSVDGTGSGSGGAGGAARSQSMLAQRHGGHRHTSGQRLSNVTLRAVPDASALLAHGRAVCISVSGTPRSSKSTAAPAPRGAPQPRSRHRVARHGRKPRPGSGRRRWRHAHQ